MMVDFKYAQNKPVLDARDLTITAHESFSFYCFGVLQLIEGGKDVNHGLRDAGLFKMYFDQAAHDVDLARRYFYLTARYDLVDLEILREINSIPASNLSASLPSPLAETVDREVDLAEIVGGLENAPFTIFRKNEVPSYVRGCRK